MTNIVIRLRRRQRCIVGYLSVNKAALAHYLPASEKWEIIQRFKDLKIFIGHIVALHGSEMLVWQKLTM